MASSDCFVVCAIDFGTTSSGWAFSFLHADPTKATIRHWLSGSGTLATEKTPTCALISPDGRTLEAFGYEAENKYLVLAEKGQHKDYYFFRKFKMSLNNETAVLDHFYVYAWAVAHDIQCLRLLGELPEKISRDLRIEDEMGKPFPAIDLFSMSIAYLAENMLSFGSNAVSGGITKSDVRWVLTVPAIWSDAAKQFMREAAKKDPASINPERLYIALEPEAASIFCRHLPVENVRGSDTIGLSMLPAGSKYLVLDAGGGTIDITVHEVTGSDRLKEVHAATGGGCGGILVDGEFENLLVDILGKQIYEKFKKNETEDWLDIWRAFEVKKKTILPGSSDTLSMKFPLSLIDLYHDESGLDLRSRIKQSKYSSMMHLMGDKIRFDVSVMQSLFYKSIEKTIFHIESVLSSDKARDVGAILMVGGYSESPMLQEAIKAKFRNIKIFIPAEASSAILRGAVILGYQPNLISHRVLRKTYGFAVSADFKEGVHPENRKVILNGVAKCDNMFSKHAEKGQLVVVGEPQVVKRYRSPSSDLKELCFRLFASDLTNPEYTDEGCEKVGELTVDISDVTGGRDRSIMVNLTFSGTEIEVTATTEKTGKVVSASFDFLC